MLQLRLTAIAVLSVLLTACQDNPPNPRASNQSKQQESTMSTADTQPADNALATFGNGCFWCTEAIFLQVDGVDKVTSGYAGGELPNPTYQQVCSGNTGHAEAIQLVYRPEKVDYETLLDVFFATHDPTTLNRQGADVGTQYRSVIFPHNETQRAAAKAKIEELNEAGAFDDPIVTTIEEMDTFYPAEDYHQNYYARNKRQGYCRMVIAPKLKKFKQQKDDLLGK